MRVIGRSEWGARYTGGFRAAPTPAQRVWLHHSVTIAPDMVPPWDDDDAAVRTLERIGQQRFGGGISYTFAITPIGRIYEGHGIARQGAHTRGDNTHGRAICLIGNYETARPTAQQIAAVGWLLGHGHAAGWWRAARLAGGHRDAPGASTACPGRHAHAVMGAMNAAASGAPATPTPAAGARHIVVPGDTLWALSRRFDTTPEALRALNGLSGDLIRPGQALIVGAPPPPAPAPPPPTASRPTLREGAVGQHVADLQAFMNRNFPAYARIPLGPRRYGPVTIAAMREFQRRVGITADGITGPQTYAQLARFGYR